jgi:polar amino acid transport system substrate-binding protein
MSIKSRWIFFLATAAVVVAQIYLLVPARAEETVRLAVGEWKPFISESLPKNGPVLEVVSRSFEEEGIKVEYTFRPWKRAMVMTKKGKFDGTPGWIFSDERAQDFDFSSSLLTQKDVIIFHRDHLIDFSSAADFSGKRTLVLLGSYVGDEFDQMAKKGQLTVGESRNYLQMFKMLLKERTDFIYVGELIAADIIRSKLSNFQRAQLVVKDSFRKPHNYHLLVSRANANGTKILGAFNSGLNKLRSSGEYDQIIRKAYIQDQ